MHCSTDSTDFNNKPMNDHMKRQCNTKAWSY